MSDYQGLLFDLDGVDVYKRQLQTCIKYSVWLVFMIYRMNEDKLQFMKDKRARVALAKATRAKRTAAAAA